MTACSLQHRPFSAEHATTRSAATLIPRSRLPRRVQLMQVRATASAAGKEAFIGVDFGTSGARASAIDDDGELLCEFSVKYSSEDLAQAWQRALWELLAGISADVKSRTAALAIDGTSATMLLLDDNDGSVLAPPILYNAAQPAASVEFAKRIAPRDHTTTASTSSLCKVITWHQEQLWQRAAAEGQTPVVLDQASWLASLLHGERRATDYNNSLKLGYDPGEEVYPAWLADREFACLLPAAVFAPGTPVAQVTPEAAQASGLPTSCWVCAGTTDSIAAFLAAGVTEVGQAVTSLGSTLAIKLLSDRRVDDARFGVYSHRLGDTWLVGGASNVGGTVLRRYFSDAELGLLTRQMDASKPTGLDYYPLAAPGERFPVNDPDLAPRLEPRPESDALFLQGIFEGIARVEAQAYRLLADMGASTVQRVVTAGGGAVNPVWTAIRQRELGVPVERAVHGEASYGAALLARQGYRSAVPQGLNM